jgi:hypothetical protein
MSESRSQNIQLSEETFFSVENVPSNPTKKKISFFYKDDKHVHKSMMLVTLIIE